MAHAHSSLPPHSYTHTLRALLHTFLHFCTPSCSPAHLHALLHTTPAFLHTHTPANLHTFMEAVLIEWNTHAVDRMAELAAHTLKLNAPAGSADTA